MSRSRKRHPWYKDTPAKGMKRIANKKVRRSDVPNGNGYKKVFDSYNLSDFKFYCPDEKEMFYIGNGDAHRMYLKLYRSK